MSIDTRAEYKAELDRLRAERDIVWQLLIDEVQFNGNIPREQAELKVTNEVFQRMQRAGL